MNAESELEDILKVYKDALQSKYEELNVTNFDLSPTTKTDFNGHPAIKLSFKLTLMNVKHRGVMYCFQICGKTVTILAQEAVDDIGKNKAGMDKIMATFGCKS